jgi:tRNA modification GTPase
VHAPHVFSTDDTIVAVATAAGHGGIGVVRLNGPSAATIGQQLATRSTPWPPRRVVRARIRTRIADVDALVTYFQAPASFTGEDVVEVSSHGNPLVLSSVVESAVTLGARVAQRGEFTLRAFLNGKLDLSQAEAVRELVEAVSPAQVRGASHMLDGSLRAAIERIVTTLRAIEVGLEASMDFPDEGYRFLDAAACQATLSTAIREIDRIAGPETRPTLVREGAVVAIVGAPNVGKSSLFNALVGTERAIVSPVPGTTRDLVSERIVFGDALAVLVDTAGLRNAAEAVEAEGVRRARDVLASADAVVVVLDGTRALGPEEEQLLAGLNHPCATVVINKADLVAHGSASRAAALGSRVPLEVSAATGLGLDTLVRRLSADLATISGADESVPLVNVRHRRLLLSAREHVDRAFRVLEAQAAEELAAADIRNALAALEEVGGRRAPDDLLGEIFAKFCIGK